MRVARASLVYFLLVFAAGFALGTLRVLVIVPRIGARAAELLELPLMLAICALAARWVVRTMNVGRGTGERLAVGTIAAALLLACEFGIVLNLRGLTLSDYLAGRDPVASSAYFGAVALMALMPTLVARR